MMVERRGHEQRWWKESVVYQIYPASFKDGNGDGIGDIRGIISKLDYIKALGVDVIWICPHYQSPQVDMGYDISNFEAVHEPYGSLDDVQALIDATHTYGMKIIFDLVINHTSSLHSWFLESRASKSSPKRDWYIWRPPKFDVQGNRHPPNNWRSQFTVPAWTFDETTQEYYFHIYAPEMPDLNWENKECREAIYQSSMRFWLDRGIDGFRIDTVNKYSKDHSFPDAAIIQPGEVTQPAMQHYSNGPRMAEFLTEMRGVFDQYDIFTVGELPNTPLQEDVLAYVSASRRQLDMVFNFDTVDLGKTRGNTLVPTPFTTADFIREMSKWQSFVNGTDAWTTVFLENHDQGRSISRFASDAEEDRFTCGKMFAIILCCMTGTLFLYQGQEIGMINIPPSWPVNEYKDIRTVNFYNQVCQRSSWDPTALQKARKGVQSLARDHARLPMQWNNSLHGGFTAPSAIPWMRASEDYRVCNVENQLSDEESLFQFWKRMLKLRKEYKDLFVYGHFELLDELPDLYCFTKQFKDEIAIIIANLSGSAKSWQIPPGMMAENFSLVVSNKENSETAQLLGWESRVYIGKKIMS